MNNVYVYCHRKINTNQVFYVGIGIKKRPYDFIRRSILWKRIYNKYGCKVEILYSNLTWKEACDIEIKLIRQYGRLDNKTGILANLTDGGEGLFNPGTETRKRMSIAHIGHNIGDKNPMKLEVNKLKISKFMTDHNPMKDKHHTDDAKKKLAIATSRLKSGISLSLLHKQNIAKGKQKRVLNLTTGIIYESLLDCATQNKITYARVSHILRGFIKPRGLYIKILN